MGSEGFLDDDTLVRTHRIGDTGIAQKSTRKVRFFLENSMLDDDALFLHKVNLIFPIPPLEEFRNLDSREILPGKRQENI